MKTPKELLIRSLQDFLNCSKEEAEKSAERIVKIGKELYKEEK